jgi:hypothetical protein
MAHCASDWPWYCPYPRHRVCGLYNNTLNMKVVKSEENLLEFDNGLKVVGDGDVDCCAYNYLDFEQLPVDTELEDMNLEEFRKAITLKGDGFIVKDKEGTPKWVQARSSQNGYYSDITALVLEQNGESVRCGEFEGEQE